MGAPDAETERQVAGFVAQVEAAAGKELICLAMYGSGAGDDWVPGRSDVNVAIVVERVSVAVLDALAPAVAGRPSILALPLVVDAEFLSRACDTFPMELSDLAREHRVLAGRDVLSEVAVDRDAIRRECEQEARGKLLRLRALYLQTADDPEALDRVMVGSLKSFLVILRHFLRLRDGRPGPGYAGVLEAAEATLGPLPVMRRLFEHRAGRAPLAPPALRGEFGGYLGEVERIVAALDRLDG
jgi:hypothetical protein